ncbi:MAG: hypothetical protein LBE61_17355 [Burkholderiaceae bacterium]|nr:hypothetical protein [Burkholderiaceae bacterium]
MTRDELEHIVRACGRITDWLEFMVAGSQAILGEIEFPPESLVVSMELDMWPHGDLTSEERDRISDLIEGSIGEGSVFHDTHKVYAQGIGPETIKVPSDFLDRLTRICNRGTDPYIAYCLSPIDVFIGKAVAKREKDRVFCQELLRHGYVNPSTALVLCDKLPPGVDISRVKATIRRWAKDVDLPVGP